MAQVYMTIRVSKMTNLFYDLPEAVQYNILKKISNETWVHDISAKHKFVWTNPSERLIELCKDTGSIQQGHHELDEMIDDCNMWAYKACVNEKCENCKMYGFPCLNLSHYGFENVHLCGIWNPNF